MFPWCPACNKMSARVMLLPSYDTSSSPSPLGSSSPPAASPWSRNGRFTVGVASSSSSGAASRPRPRLGRRGTRTCSYLSMSNDCRGADFLSVESSTPRVPSPFPGVRKGARGFVCAVGAAVCTSDAASAPSSSEGSERSSTDSTIYIHGFRFSEFEKISKPGRAGR